MAGESISELAQSARRHLRAAKELTQVSSPGAQRGCRVVAGYLFGLAGELAIKELMRASGIPTPQVRTGPYFAHFPNLHSQLKLLQLPRRAEELRKVVAKPHQFQNWNIEMRYRYTEDVKDEWIDSWKNEAEDLVSRIGLK